MLFLHSAVVRIQNPAEKDDDDGESDDVPVCET